MVREDLNMLALSRLRCARVALAVETLRLTPLALPLPVSGVEVSVGGESAVHNWVSRSSEVRLDRELRAVFEARFVMSGFRRLERSSSVAVRAWAEETALD